MFFGLGFHLRGPGSDWDCLRLKVGLPYGDCLDRFTDGCLRVWNDSGLWDLGDLGYRHIDSLGFYECCLGSATGGCRDVLSGASRRSPVSTWSGNNESAGETLALARVAIGVEGVSTVWNKSKIFTLKRQV